MKSKIVVFLIAALFVFTTFAGASVIQTDRLDPKPCPAVNIPPGLREFHFSPKGQGPYGREWKNVDKNEDVTFKSDLCFVQWGNGANFIVWDGNPFVKIPKFANRIDITLKERKNGGPWTIICQETIESNQTGSNHYYNHYFTKKYSEEGKYEIRATGRAYGNTILYGEIYWDTGSILETVTLGVGDVKSKQRTPLNLILEILHSILNNDNILFQRLLNY